MPINRIRVKRVRMKILRNLKNIRLLFLLIFFWLVACTSTEHVSDRVHPAANEMQGFTWKKRMPERAPHSLEFFFKHCEEIGPSTHQSKTAYHCEEPHDVH